MPDTIVTQLTALYAAVVSTATAAWTVYKDWNDTGRLKVTVGFRSLIGNGMIEENLLVWSITNTGKRSVMLTHALGELRPTDDDKGFTKFLVDDPQLPKRLEPGDCHMSICRKFDFRSDLVRLFASDSLNRDFNAPPGDIEQVNKKVWELRAKGIEQSSVRPARSGG